MSHIKRSNVICLITLMLLAFLSACSSGGGSSAPAASSAKAITAYSLAGVTGTINETAKTIAVTMPYGTDVTALVATFTSNGASVKVASTAQVSGTTANNFTNPVVYTVTAADDSTALYTVTVSTTPSTNQMGGAIQSGPLSLTGAVTTFAGTATVSGSTDATGTAARFKFPYGITSDGISLYVADENNFTVRRINIATGDVSTLAGTAGMGGSTDGTGAAARFYPVSGITTDGTNLFVTDSNSNTIRKIVISSGVVTTLAGTSGSTGSTDGTGAAARFNNPQGITTDGSNLYVADTYNHTVRKIVISSGEVTTLAGTATIFGTDNGTGSAARFYAPVGITTDGTNLYVADTDNSLIRKIVIASGEVTTLAGTVGFPGSADGTGTAAKFYDPYGITSDGTNLYVADSFNQTVRKIVIASAEVTTLAGMPGTIGAADGTGTAASFNYPEGITTDGSSLYVTELFGNTVRKIQ